MEYIDVVADFAQGTRLNLGVLKKAQQAGEQAPEVTALVNSLLGLLVFPQQRFIDAIPRTPLDDLRAQGWPVPAVRGRFKQVRDLRQLIRYLRNAVAHFNLRFLADSAGQIEALVVWNVCEGQKTWEATLSVQDLEGIVDRFSGVLKQHHLVGRQGQRD